MDMLLTSTPLSIHHTVTPFTTGLRQHTTTARLVAGGGRRNCLCCSDVLLRHVRAGQIYWRCGNCHQEMPSLD